jgi:hypothetical protein
MRRHLVICLVLAACEPGLPSRPLPELVKPVPITAIRMPMMIVPGETLAWNVNAKGFTIGRAELATDEHEIRSRFATSKLASAFARARHELTTVVGPGGAQSATDLVELDGATTRVQTMFSRDRFALSGVENAGGVIPGGNVGHTLHTALATIRAWADPSANAGFLFVVHAGEMVRIDFARPFVEDMRGVRTLRVECRVQGETPISLTVWLRASDDRTPIRFEIASGAVRLTAELLETDV